MTTADDTTTHVIRVLIQSLVQSDLLIGTLVVAVTPSGNIMSHVSGRPSFIPEEVWKIVNETAVNKLVSEMEKRGLATEIKGTIQ